MTPDDPEGATTPDAAAEAPVPFTAVRPSIPRVYGRWQGGRDPHGQWRGGKDTFAPDRAIADLVVEKVPGFEDVIWQNWAFLKRAVGHLAKEAGVQQFIDIGPGLPVDGEPLLPDIARKYQPEASWLAVDNDQQVLVRWRQELDRGDDRLQVMFGDLRDPARILANSQRFLNLSRPTAVLMGAVVHFVLDEDGPADIMRTFRDTLAPGSRLVLTHATADGAKDDAKAGVKEAAEEYTDAVARITLRSYDQVAALLDGWTLREPGLAKTVDLLVPEDGLIYAADAPHAWAAVAVVSRE
ncbi:SAM-dependent methyltransferase [Nonomuraea basaltis]|uniref:SAM-dependent methyltransferase n=1 Tax=Nonomuraea basaltis TaxID=2495887 RepID=UPI00110C4491|nr:SAM-dependent methyltransferase [Nonomuraea basaltis]TMR97318.1 hypothetical protein EJK15_18780 [Nonomuraea basaltis]